VLIRYSTDSKGRPVKKAVVYTKEEHFITREKIDPDALYVINQLRSYGYDAYIVGGAVRDLLIGNTPKDFDIVTDATPTKIKRLFRNSRIIGRRFRLVHVFFDDKIFEVSTFRSISDGTVGNSFGTMDEDVQRRDFSINALYFDTEKEHIIDYVDGVKDIRKSVIKPVISLDLIFAEDPVRMIRAVKYAATTNSHMSISLKRKIRKSAHLLLPVSPSRLTEEFIKILNSGHAYDIIKIAKELDLYMYLQPMASALMDENSEFEKKYFKHLKQLDSLHKSSNSVRLGEKLAFIIWDYIQELTNWDKEIESKTAVGELYSKTWTQCRNFVLPMNPQRTELEYGIRTVLKAIGVPVYLSTSKSEKKDTDKPKKSSNPYRRHSRKNNLALTESVVCSSK